MRVLSVVALILGVAAAPAAADTTLVPRDGQVWTAPATQELVAYASDYEELPDAFTFAVATDPAIDADGRLAAPVRRSVAPAQPDHPGIYVAPIRLDAPGTYYWQASYSDDDGDAYALPVRTLKVTPALPPDAPAPPAAVPPPAPPMPVATPRPPDARTVRIAVRRAIHTATHMVARGLAYRCAGTTCRPSWHDVRARYRGTLRLTFGASAISATFTGTRTPLRRGHARALTWTTTL